MAVSLGRQVALALQRLEQPFALRQCQTLGGNRGRQICARVERSDCCCVLLRRHVIVRRQRIPGVALGRNAAAAAWRDGPWRAFGRRRRLRDNSAFASGPPACAADRSSCARGIRRAPGSRPEIAPSSPDRPPMARISERTLRWPSVEWGRGNRSAPSRRNDPLAGPREAPIHREGERATNRSRRWPTAERCRPWPGWANRPPRGSSPRACERCLDMKGDHALAEQRNRHAFRLCIRFRPDGDCISAGIAVPHRIEGARAQHFPTVRIGDVERQAAIGEGLRRVVHPGPGRRRRPDERRPSRVKVADQIHQRLRATHTHDR